MSRVVLVTGVARYVGGAFARLLQADPDISRVIGVDVVPPKHDMGDVEFLRADLRTPITAGLLDKAGVDTVVHAGVVATPLSAGGRAPMKEINVVGTMHLLSACQHASRLRKLVVKSSTSVYGSSPLDPALFTEDMEPNVLAPSGYAKDTLEVENYLRGFSRRRPDVAVTTLRFANFVGPRVQTALSSYFSLPIVPTVMGFDPRLQFISEDDGLEALRRATVEDHPGTFNIAGAGVVLLSQAIHRAGRTHLPVPAQLAPLIGVVLRRAGVADFSPEQVRFLSYGRVVDTTAMRRDFGFVPSRTTLQAYDEFVAAFGLHGVLSPDRVAVAERVLLDVAGRVRRWTANA